MRMTEKVVSAQVVTATGNLALGQAPDWAL